MKETTSIVFTGDIGFDRFMEGKWEDPDLIAGEVLSFLHNADHVVANVEGPIVDVPSNQTTEGAVQLMHTMNPGAVKVLNNMRTDIWNICNNHIMDAGEEGIAATIAQAKRNNVYTLGAGMNIDEAISRLDGIDCGGRGTSCPDQLAKALKAAKEQQ